MSKQESINIKDEILKKEVSIHIGNALTIDDVILIQDVLDIINNHTEEKKKDK